MVDSGSSIPDTKLSVEDWIWSDEQDPPFHQKLVNRALQKYSNLLFPDGQPCSVFVPLCGKTVDLIYLADLGHKVAGLEFSEIGVECFFKENNLTFIKKELDDAPFVVYKSNEKDITIYRGDMFAMKVAICGQFDVVFDRGSYVAINKAQRLEYTDLLFTLMKPTSKCLLETFSYDASQYGGPPHNVTEKDLSETFGRRCSFKLLDAQPIPDGKIAEAPKTLKFKSVNYFIAMK